MGPYGTILGHNMGPNRSIPGLTDHTRPYGATWGHLGLYWAIGDHTDHMRLNKTIQDHMGHTEPYGTKQNHTGPYRTKLDHMSP